MVGMPHLGVLPANVLFGSDAAYKGGRALATALYKHDLDTLEVTPEKISMIYRNEMGGDSWLRIIYDRAKPGYYGEKFLDGKSLFASMGSEFDKFFTIFTRNGLTRGERCRFDPYQLRPEPQESNAEDVHQTRQPDIPARKDPSTQKEFEEFKATLASRVNGHLREMLANPNDRTEEYVKQLKGRGDAAIENICRHHVSAVMSTCDQAYLLHLSPSPTNLSGATNSNGSFSKDLHDLFVTASTRVVIRAYDIRLAMHVYKPYEQLIEDKDYLLAIVRKNAGDPGMGIWKMDMEEYWGRSGPEISYMLTVQHNKDHFEAEVWAFAAYCVAGSVPSFEEAINTACDKSKEYWSKQIPASR
jgi:hypothetical protein